MKVSAVIRGIGVGILAAAIVGGGFWLAKSGGGQNADPSGTGKTSTAEPLAKNDDEPDETADAAASTAPTASAAASTETAATASPAATASTAPTASAAASTETAATASPTATASTASASPAATAGTAASTETTASASPAATTAPETVIFEVRKGEDASTVSQNLEDAGIIEDADKFSAYLEQTGASGRLRVGTYTLSVGASYPTLAKALAGPSK